MEQKTQNESFISDFIDTVRLMREKQCEYMRTMDIDALHSVKLLERQVDRMLRMMGNGEDAGAFRPASEELSSRRLAVIEFLEIGNPDWTVWESYGDGCMDSAFLRGRCECLMREHTNLKFRYRYGTLTLDPSDKCETFKSE